MDRGLARKKAKQEYKELIKAGKLNKNIRFPDFWNSFVKLSKAKAPQAEKVNISETEQGQIDSMVMEISDPA